MKMKIATKKYRNKLHHVMRIAETMHYNELLEANKTNMAKQWPIMKDIIGKKKQ